MTRDATTIEGAIEWLDLALRETRQTLAQAHPELRDKLTVSEAQVLAIRCSRIARGVTVGIWPKALLDWHGIRATSSTPGLEVFDAWLAAARAGAGR